MSRINIFYQVNFFSNFSDITVSTDSSIKLMNIFREFDLISGIFYEIGPGSPNPIPRPRFASINNEWVVSIGSEKISIDKNLVDGADDLGDPSDFVRKATNILGAFLLEYNKKGKRVALITQGFFNDMSKEQMGNVYLKLSKPNDFYIANPPFEWSQRTVSKINYNIIGNTEEINVITNISRVQGQMLKNNNQEQFDRILLEFDINTIAQNDETRFTKDSLINFLNDAIGTRDFIYSKVEEIINE